MEEIRLLTPKEFESETWEGLIDGVPMVHGSHPYVVRFINQWIKLGDDNQRPVIDVRRRKARRYRHRFEI